jgi:hypothetical protein
MSTVSSLALRPARSASVPAFVTVALTWVAVLFFLWPGKNSLPAGAVSSASFFLAQLLFPSCRFSFRHLVSPLNWMLCVFALQLVVMPAAVRIAGPSSFVLPALPSPFAINFALMISTVAFWSFCVSVQIFRRRGPARGHRPARAQDWIPGRKLPLLFAVLGCVGMALRFGSLERLGQYITDPAIYMGFALEAAEKPATLAGATGTFLTPFLGFAFVLLLCRSIDLPVKEHERGRWLGRVVLIALTAAAYSTMTYNRGSFAVPMVAIATVIGKRMPRAALRYLLATGLVFGLLVSAVTFYREAPQTAALSATEAAGLIEFGGIFQEYGQAPQRLGYFLERNHFAEEPLLGRTVICSVLSPVPVLGKGFRDCSGAVVYNATLQRLGADQIFQAEGELFLDFHIFGVVFGFVLLGWAVAKIQLRFELTSAAAEVYVLVFATVWLGFLTVGSIDVLAQIAIYSCPPIYLYLWVRARQRRQNNPGRRRLLLDAAGPERGVSSPASDTL